MSSLSNNPSWLRRDYLQRLIMGIAVMLWVGLASYAITRWTTRGLIGVLFLGTVILIYTLNELQISLKDNKRLDAGLLLVIILSTVIVTTYTTLNFHELIVVRRGFGTQLDYIMGAQIVLIILYLVYRSYGLGFFSVLAATFIYAYFGPVFPSWFSHTGLTIKQILLLSSMDITGVYGNLNQIVATWIALFMLFSSLMQNYGAISLIITGTAKLRGYIDSGVSQAAVLSSMIVGSINGSAIANVAITGSITIPLMKESGVKAETAGAIESVASSGGQIIPPIMGVSAFLMANILGRPYSDIMIAAIVPAIVFYLAVIVAVHYFTIRDIANINGEISEVTDISEKIEDPIESRRELAVEVLKFGIPIVVLVYLLGIAQFTILYSALIANGILILTCVGLPLLRDPSLTHAKKLAGDTVEGLYDGALATAPIGIVVAGIGAMVEVLVATGTPTKFAIALVELSGGTLWIALIFAMVLAIILGMGMPTAPAYLLVATLIAPGITQNFAIPELATHFFLFYAVVLSALTPPIAVAIVVATGVADSDFLGTAVTALKISLPLFILPFTFIYEPYVISTMFTVQKFIGFLFLGIGGITVTYGLSKRFTYCGVFKYPFRLSYSIIGICIMIIPILEIKIVGVLMAILIQILDRYLNDHTSILPTILNRDTVREP